MLNSIKDFLIKNKLITFLLMLLFFAIAVGLFIFLSKGLYETSATTCNNLPIACNVLKVDLTRITAIFLALSLGCMIFFIPKNILSFINNGLTSKTNMTQKEKKLICLRNIVIITVLFITAIVINFQFMINSDDNTKIISISAWAFIVIIALFIIGILYSIKPILEENTTVSNSANSKTDKNNL